VMRVAAGGSPGDAAESVGWGAGLVVNDVVCSGGVAEGGGVATPDSREEGVESRFVSPLSLKRFRSPSSLRSLTSYSSSNFVLDVKPRLPALRFRFTFAVEDGVHGPTHRQCVRARLEHAM